ncbi:MAG: DUF3500 domain-containing protein [Bryobacteraceae bacterium]|nr:DUF3500 domain-containing protein [Bryobacteraceae bacterium]MDW8379875.1 DUF3500 domain-containing protein [Bryobacterales bacterium]
MLRRAVLFGAFTILLTSAYYRVSSPFVMSEAANAFLASLTPEQREKAQFDFQDEERFFFHFVPDNNLQQLRGRSRKGLTLREMSPHQKHLAHALLSAGLSQRGYIKATSIMSLEDVLRILEKDSGERRNPEKYYFSIFGQPKEKGAWGYRVEGHHISIHFTIVDGKVVSAPFFYGANPALVKEGPRAGLRVLAREEDLARDLLLALTPEQKKIAIVSPKAYADILTEASRKAALQGQPSGLSASKMNAKQRQLLQALLEEYCYNLPDQPAQHRLDLIRKAGTNIFFAWAGVEEKGGPHYYRIQGPTFLVEYDNTQNNANHIHSVWREMDGDWAEDLLKAHYQSSHQSSPR